MTVFTKKNFKKSSCFVAKKDKGNITVASGYLDKMKRTKNIAL